MEKYTLKKLMDHQGFSLVEIVIGAAIIGVLGVIFSGSLATRETKNMTSDGRDILSTLQRAKLEAVRQGVCAGVTLKTGAAPPADLSGVPPGNRGSFDIFIDDGAGGGTACNAIQDGTEQRIGQRQLLRDGVALTQSTIAATIGDPNLRQLPPNMDTDLFDSISFDPRSFVAARVWNGARAIVIRNDPNPANASWWGRVIVTPSGSVEYQTNNNPGNENIWSR